MKTVIAVPNDSGETEYYFRLPEKKFLIYVPMLADKNTLLLNGIATRRAITEKNCIAEEWKSNFFFVLKNYSVATAAAVIVTPQIFRGKIDPTLVQTDVVCTDSATLAVTEDFDFEHDLVREVALEIRNTVPSEKQNALTLGNAVLSWLRTNISYTLVPPLLRQSYTDKKSRDRAFRKTVRKVDHDAVHALWEDEYSASKTLLHREAKCNGFATTFVALMRSLRIPSVFCMGRVHTRHSWAAIHIPPFGWVEIDPTSNSSIGEFNYHQYLYRLFASAEVPFFVLSPDTPAPQYVIEACQELIASQASRCKRIEEFLEKRARRRRVPEQLNTA